MPTPTYEPITTVTATGGNSILVMSSIPQTYTDLVLTVNGNNGNDDEFQLRFNSDSGSNYRVLFMYGDGSTVSAAEYTSTTFAQMGGIYSTGTRTGSNLINIGNYSNTNVHKNVVSIANSGNYLQFRNNTWRNTNAINRIDAFLASGSTFTNPTTFSLYGIKAAV
jgi:hypothetical protein